MRCEECTTGVRSLNADVDVVSDCGVMGTQETLKPAASSVCQPMPQHLECIRSLCI